jgi:hypothetical protein
MNVAVNPATVEAAAPVVNNDDESFREFFLNALRGASLRARLMANELDTLGVAFKNKFISSEDAMRALDELDCWFLIPEMMRDKNEH